MLAAFDLGEPMSGGPLHEMGWDSHRARCAVETPRGHWFLKKHHPAVHRPEQHRVMNAFRELGGRAPEIMAQESGDTWHEAPDGAWFAEAHRVVPGAPPERVTENLALDAIEQMAIWHRVPVGIIPETWTGWYGGNDSIELCRHALQTLAAHGLSNNAVAGLLRSEAEYLAHEPVCEQQVPVHADLWLGNWVADSGRIAALTDFDWLHRGSRLDDLADAILAFASDRDTPLERDSALDTGVPVDANRARLMLTQYETAAGALSPGERQELPNRLRSAWVRHFVWIVLRAPERLYLEVAFTRAAEFAEWMQCESGL